MVNNNWWGSRETQFFFELTPDRVLQAVETAGVLSTGRCSPLNSFENRVYEVELDPESPGWELGPDSPSRGPSQRYRVAKFYRPGRWSQEQILEEHAFLAELAADEVPAIAPLPFADGTTLRQEPESGVWFALFPKVGGRAPDELSAEQARRVGRLLARTHAVGSRTPYRHRLRWSSQSMGGASLEYLRSAHPEPSGDLARALAAGQALTELARERVDGIPQVRLHGDCHLGNLLWNDRGPFFLDFDDSVSGPAVQDLWLLLPGRVLAASRGGDELARERLADLLEGYEELRSFDRSSLAVIEILRGMRLLHFAAWIGRRWQDPAFPHAFPHYGSSKYWAELAQDLEEQVHLALAPTGSA